jgi:hypothetical protein
MDLTTGDALLRHKGVGLVGRVICGQPWTFLVALGQRYKARHMGIITLLLSESFDLPQRAVARA